jgi:hypothetical protein
MMNSRLIAQIGTTRQITHDKGHTVHISWDGQHATLSREQFTDLVCTLERSEQDLYSSAGGCSVVNVDDITYEVWIDDYCLNLHHDELRSLLNAVLTTETRLHGFRVAVTRPVLPAVETQLVATIRPVKPVQHYCN